MLDLSAIKDIGEAKRLSKDCPNCGNGVSGSGLATVFHLDYDGKQPFVVDFRPSGERVNRVTRTTAYCNCAAGQWTMELHRRESPDVFNRMNTLDDILAKGSFWSLGDPTLATFDASLVPDWEAFRRKITGKKGVVKPVGDAAREPDRETPDDIYDPQRDARSSRRAIVKDDYGQPKHSPVAVATEADDEVVFD